MNRYHPTTPRIASALAAVALSAATLALTVVVPATTLDHPDAGRGVLASANVPHADRVGPALAAVSAACDTLAAGERTPARPAG